MPHLCLLRLISTQQLLRLGRQPRQLLADRHQAYCCCCCCCLIHKAELGGALAHLAGWLASIGVDKQCCQTLVVVGDRQQAHFRLRWRLVIYACVWAVLLRMAVQGSASINVPQFGSRFAVQKTSAAVLTLRVQSRSIQAHQSVLVLDLQSNPPPTLVNTHTHKHQQQQLRVMLLTRVLQRGVTLSPATAALLPTCATAAAAWLSTSSSLLQQQNPQLMRLKQQPSDNSRNGDQQHSGYLWTYLGAGGAAAAAAGWAAYAYSNSSSVSAPPISPMRLAHASPCAQAAVGAAACAAPLLHLQHALNPTPAQLQGIAAALEAEADTLGPELAVALWGLAMFGAVLPQQQLARLAAAAIDQMPQLPVYEAILAGEGV